MIPRCKPTVTAWVRSLTPSLEDALDVAFDRFLRNRQSIGNQLVGISWARTVKSPDPAFRKVDVPLASTFMLSMKPGKEAYVDPIIEDGGYRFTVKVGRPRNPEAAKNGTKVGRGHFKCLMSGSPMPVEYIRFSRHCRDTRYTLDGDRCRRGARTNLPVAYKRDGGYCSTGETDMEARCPFGGEVSRQRPALWAGDICRSSSLHGNSSR